MEDWGGVEIGGGVGRRQEVESDFALPTFYSSNPHPFENSFVGDIDEDEDDGLHDDSALDDYTSSSMPASSTAADTSHISSEEHLLLSSIDLISGGLTRKLTKLVRDGQTGPVNYKASEKVFDMSS
ncbi:hypothetical protein EON65_47180 [archaeon]|nr:MAG: hypothetical protein EON65_47180 [archaeon]